jgi:enoyl-CoA hydratase
MRQMMLTYAPLNAETALRIGLVNELVAHEDLLPRAIEVTELFALAKGVSGSGYVATRAETIATERDPLAAREATGAMQWSS